MLGHIKALVSAFMTTEEAVGIAVEKITKTRVDQLSDIKGWSNADAFKYVKENEMKDIKSRAKLHIDEIV